MNFPTNIVSRYLAYEKGMLAALILCLATISLSPSIAMDLPLMTWDVPEKGIGLHVQSWGYDKSGDKWSVREIQLNDTGFYQCLFANRDVMKSVATGQTVSPEETEKRVKHGVRLFAEGNPCSRMTVCDQGGKPLGWVQLFAGTKPGVGEVVRVFSPDSQGKGLGTATLKFLVEEWAPAVRHIALGDGLNRSESAIEKFKCFKGDPLQLIYTTARPQNRASWECYKHVGFRPSQPGDSTNTLSCENWEATQHGSLEEYITTKYFVPSDPDSLKMNILYPMIDEGGNTKTISFVEKYGSLRYHFEREVS